MIPAWLVFELLLLSPAADTVPAHERGAIVGVVTAADGKAYVARPYLDRPSALALHDALGVGDVLETELHSRVKILFHPDILLTLGEESRVEILGDGARRGLGGPTLLVRLVRGSVRGLVGDGSTTELEVSAAEARLVARESAFLVNVPAPGRIGALNGSSGTTREGPVTVVNIGTTAGVSFRSGHQAVVLEAGQHSTAYPRRAPSPPSLVLTGRSQGAAAIQDLLRATQLPDQPKPQPASRVLQASGGVLPGAAEARPTAGVDGADANATQAVPGPRLTPPAVISGVVGGAGAADQTGGDTGSVVSPPLVPTLPGEGGGAGRGKGKRGKD